MYIHIHVENNHTKYDDVRVCLCCYGSWDLVGSSTVIGNTCTSTPAEDFDLLGLLLLPIESASE